MLEVKLFFAKDWSMTVAEATVGNANLGLASGTVVSSTTETAVTIVVGGRGALALWVLSAVPNV